MISIKLVKKAKNGDKEAFNDLIIYYQNDLYNIAKCKLHNEDDVCDAIQETILNAYSHIDSLKNSYKFKSWLIKILINECNKIYLKYKNNCLEINDELILSTEDIGSSNIEFLDLINKLNKDEQEIFILYYKEKYSTKEISNILNINENTIRSKISRGKEKIKNSLKEGL